MYGFGISREGSILDVAAELGVISKSGAWYSYGDERLGQGRENVKEYLREHPEITREVELKIRQALNIAGMKAAPPVTAPQESSTAK